MPISQQIPTYEGFGAIVPLDYGHEEHKEEHSLLLVPDDWDSLPYLLAMPFKFLEKARARFFFNESTENYLWETLGPISIILDPLTVPSRASAEGLRTLAAMLSLKHERRCGCGEDSIYGEVSESIRNVIPQWQGLNHEDWREKVIEACSEPGQPCRGFYLVEYALLTRVMVVRYVPPALSIYEHNPFYNDNITSVTFSDFLHGLGAHFLPRTAYMHFDLKPNDDQLKLVPHNEGYSHWSAARMKAEFAVDYIMDPLWTLGRLCVPGKRLMKGKAKFDYNYASATFGADGTTLSITKTSDAQEGSDFPVTEHEKPRLDRINGDYDPTVILESVDPWANGWLWKQVPIDLPPSDQQDPQKEDLSDDNENTNDRVFQPMNDDGPDDDVPLPCILIYITVNGEGQWVIDPSSTLVKNYVAPTMGGS